MEVGIVLRSSTEEQRFREGMGVKGSRSGYANERRGEGSDHVRWRLPLASGQKPVPPAQVVK